MSGLGFSGPAAFTPQGRLTCPHPRHQFGIGARRSRAANVPFAVMNAGKIPRQHPLRLESATRDQVACYTRALPCPNSPPEDRVEGELVLFKGTITLWKDGPYATEEG
jgi:hypothetical protein